jgi:ketosteroid isomerase-like protein
LLEAFGEAWNARDIDRLVSMITDDCVYCASVGAEPGTTYAGKEAVRRGFLKMLAFDAGGESCSGRAFVAGNLGIAEWSYIFQRTCGVSFEVRGCDIFEFRDGRISRKDAFRKAFPENTGFTSSESH